MVYFSVSNPNAPDVNFAKEAANINIGTGGYSQSTPAFISPAITSPSSSGGSSGSYTSGGTTYTPTVSGSGGNANSAIQSWLSGLQSVLTNLSNTLRGWSSSSSGGGGGGGGGGSSGSSGGYYTSYTPSIPPALQSINIPSLSHSVSTPAMLESGLVSTLPSEKEELNRKQQAIATNLKSTVPTRTSLLERIMSLSPQPTRDLPAAMFSFRPPTGTTKPQQTVSQTVKVPSIEFAKDFWRYVGNTGGVTQEEGIGEAGGVRGGTTQTMSFDKVTEETANQFTDLQNALNDITTKLQQARTEADTLKEKGEVVDEDWMTKWMNELITMKDMYSNKVTPLSDQIDQMDKVLLQAQEGFRKTAEDIRNNPDLTVWQQARRLKELEDLQNYAPIFNGLSYKDLVEYRKVLADTLDKYIDAYNNTMNMASDFAINAEQLKIQRKNQEYQGLSDVLGLSQKILDLQQNLSNYGYSNYTYTDERTGKIHEVIKYEDPRTHKTTIVSDTVIGQTAPSASSSTQSTQSVDTLSLLMKEIYPRISQAVALKKPLSANDYYSFLARWHSVAGNKYDNEFDKFLKTYGVHPSSGGLGANPFG